jgi:peptidoglycan glycosyltransferase
MAMVAAGIADNGTVMRPRLVDRLTGHDGTVLSSTAPRGYRQAVSPAVAAELRSMMEDAVEHGTGSNARISGAVVGGKTGTAQNGADNRGTPYAWFIGYARPGGSAAAKVAVAVVIEDSTARRADITGGGLAAPVA